MKVDDTKEDLYFEVQPSRFTINIRHTKKGS